MKDENKVSEIITEMRKNNTMTNKKKAEEISVKYARSYAVSRNDSHKRDILFKESSVIECEESALEMAKWKDEQLNLLLDSIDHAYLQTDGTYGNLALEVADKVNYLKKLRYE